MAGKDNPALDKEEEGPAPDSVLEAVRDIEVATRDHCKHSQLCHHRRCPRANRSRTGGRPAVSESAAACVGGTTVPIIGSEARLRDELEISFHGQRVKDPHAVVVEIRNTGEAPLREEDFVDPVSVRFEPGAHWMMAVVISDPDDRRVASTKKEESSPSDPTYGTAESVYVHGLFDGDPGDAVPLARVAGVRHLQPFKRDPTLPELVSRVALEVLRASMLGGLVRSRRER